MDLNGEQTYANEHGQLCTRHYRLMMRQNSRDYITRPMMLMDRMDAEYAKWAWNREASRTDNGDRSYWLEEDK